MKPSRARKGGTKKTKSAAAKGRGGSKKEANRVAKQKYGDYVGPVTHYFSQVKAAVVKLEQQTLKLGDVVFFKGHTTGFKQKLHSMQINRVPIENARPGEEIGIEVKSRVREGDRVYRIVQKSRG